MGIQKNKVTQDFLYQFLVERGVNITTLAELMGMSETMVNSCFRHNKNARGVKRDFPRGTLPKLNEGLKEMARQMNESKLTFGSDKTYTNNRGTTYDPALVESINALHRYFKLVPFLKHTLGWSLTKKSSVLHAPSSKGYACISEQDVDRINAAITEVVIVFNSIEVVAEEGGGSIPLDNTDQQTADNHITTPTDIKKGENENSWDNPSLPLIDRYYLFHEKWPEGIIFFRVYHGYTVAQKDSTRVCELDASLTTHTDSASGTTTTYIPSDAFEKILPRCIANNWRVVVTDMYTE